MANYFELLMEVDKLIAINKTKEEIMDAIREIEHGSGILAKVELYVKNKIEL